MYFAAKLMMFSMLGFSSISAIVVTANCGLSYSAWIDVPGFVEAMCLLDLSDMEVLETIAVSCR